MFALSLQSIREWFARLESRIEAGDPLTRRILVWVFGLLVFALFFSGMKIISMEPVAGAFLTGSRSDFDDYYQASIRLRESGDLYNLERMRRLEAEGAAPDDPRRFQGVGSYLYPPLLAWLLTPLSLLNYKLAAFFFQTLSVAALLGFFYIIWRYSSEALAGNAARFHFVAILGMLVLYQFILGNVDNGNIGFFLILLGGAGLLLGFDDRPARSALGGFLLGIAVVFKITPAFLVLPLVAGGRVVAILGMGLGGLAGLALPALSLGWSANAAVLNDWYGFLIANFQKWSIVRPWANNQTLSAAVGKLLIAGADLRQGQYGLPLFFKTLPGEPVRDLIVRGVRGANSFLYLLALLSALRLWLRGGLSLMPGQAGRPASPLVDSAGARILLLAVAVSLVASGVSWYHAYSVLLLPVLFRLLQHFYGGQALRAGERLSFGLLAVFGLGGFFFGGWLREALAMYSIFVFIVLGVVFYNAYLCWLPVGKDGAG